MLDLRSRRESSAVLVRASELVKVFLKTRPEHRYAQAKLLKHLGRDTKNGLDAVKWAREREEVEAA